MADQVVLMRAAASSRKGRRQTSTSGRDTVHRPLHRDTTDERAPESREHGSGVVDSAGPPAGHAGRLGIGVRAEVVRLEVPGSGRVIAVEYLGADTLIEASRRATVHRPPARPCLHRCGRHHRAWLDAREVHWFDLTSGRRIGSNIRNPRSARPREGRRIRHPRGRKNPWTDVNSERRSGARLRRDRHAEASRKANRPRSPSIIRWRWAGRSRS